MPKIEKCLHDGKRVGPFNPYLECKNSEDDHCGKFMPFTWVYTKKETKETISTSGAAQLARAGVKK